MSFDNMLIHTCTIEPLVPGASDPYNNPTDGYGTPVTGVRCRLVEERERVWVDERQESVIQSVYKLFLPPAAVINERSRITLVTLENRTTIADVFTVSELFVRRGRNSRHQMATLERIS
jgi:hypothetical protein